MPVAVSDRRIAGMVIPGIGTSKRAGLKFRAHVPARQLACSCRGKNNVAVLLALTYFQQKSAPSTQLLLNLTLLMTIVSSAIGIGS